MASANVIALAWRWLQSGDEAGTGPAKRASLALRSLSYAASHAAPERAAKKWNPVFRVKSRSVLNDRSRFTLLDVSIQKRRDLPQHDHFRADLDPIGEIDDVAIDHADAA